MVTIHAHHWWSDDVYYAAYGTWVTIAVVALSSNAALGMPSSRVVLIGYVVSGMLLLGRVFALRYSGRELVLLGFVVVVASLSAHQSGMTAFLGLVLFVAASRGVDMEAVARTTLVALLLGVTVVLLLLAAGVATDTVYARDEIDSLRHSFGFIHPNTLGMLILNASLAWFYFRRNRDGVGAKLPVLAAIAFCSLFLDSRSAIMILLILVGLWAGIRTSIGAIVIRFSPILVVSIVLVSLALAWLYDPASPFWMGLDRLLSSRLSFAHAYLSAYGVHPLGQAVALGSISDSGVSSFIAGSRGTVDMGYVSLALQAGVLGLGSFTFLLVLAARCARASGDRALAIAVVCFSLSGLFETTVYGLQYGFPVLAAFLTNRASKDVGDDIGG